MLGAAAVKYSRFVIRALDRCTFAVWVPSEVMCHSETWQKGEEEVDELHNVGKDQEAASSPDGYEDLESVWQKRFIRLMGKIWEILHHCRLKGTFGELFYMYAELSYLPRELINYCRDPDPRHSGLAHASQDNLMSALY